jgi:hypothetical protein
MKRVITIAAAIALVFGGYYFYPQGDETGVVRVERELPAGSREYESERYGFSLFYPETLEVKEFDEGGNASTIIFQNPKEGIGFQIFVVPYAETQISDERFRKDVPSEVRTELENISIDGATGAAFYSKDLMLAETREVWFIKDGFLYEITTLREQSSWLSHIMETWLFI